jgi:hypothetical protein
MCGSNVAHYAEPSNNIKERFSGAFFVMLEINQGARMYKLVAVLVASIAVVVAPAAASAVNVVSVYRLYNTKSGSNYGEHFTTANHDEAVKNGCTNPGYVMEGRDYFNAESQAGTSVSRLRNVKTGELLYSLQGDEIYNALNAGYTWETPNAFQAFATPQAGGVTVYRYRNPKSHDRLYTTTQSEALPSATTGYTYEGVAFYFSASANYPVARLYNPSIGRHLYTANDYEVDSINCLNPTYRMEGPTYSANETSAGGDMPVYRLRDPQGYHFLTIDQAERDAAVAAGFADEGTAFYAYTTAGGSRIPVFRLRHQERGDHLLTSNSVERDNAMAAYGSGHYISEGVAFYANPL